MIVELLPPATARGFEAMRALRPALVDADEFVRRVDLVQRPTGYRLVGSFEGGDRDADGDAPAVAVAGFRTGDTLAWGRHVYIDDLSTVPGARGRGHARRLLEWVRGEAERLGCAEIHLDSGVGPDRQAAHRLYLNAGYRISSHHFQLTLRPE